MMPETNNLEIRDREVAENNKRPKLHYEPERATSEIPWDKLSEDGVKAVVNYDQALWDFCKKYAEELKQHGREVDPFVLSRGRYLAGDRYFGEPFNESEELQSLRSKLREAYNDVVGCFPGSGETEMGLYLNMGAQGSVQTYLSEIADKLGWKPRPGIYNA